MKQSMPQQAEKWIASWSLSSGTRSRDPLARNDEVRPRATTTCCGYGSLLSQGRQHHRPSIFTNPATVSVSSGSSGRSG